MKKFSRILSLLLVLCMIFALLPTAFAAGGDIDKIGSGKTVILHSNDVHGAITGYAYMAALKEKLTKAGADVILADAGDYSQGETSVSLSKGATAIEMMNAAGYDVATLGNHEFDYGYAQLQENMKKAKFKVVCSDVLDAEGAPIFAANTIIEKGGVKIGFFGLETPETQTKANPTLIKGLTFLTETTTPTIWENAQAQVTALKAAGADVVVCLAHLGVDESSEPYRSYDLYSKVTGIDFIIDGHSHTVMEKGTKEEPIQSTGTKFANIGVIVIDNATKKIESNYLEKIGEGGFNEQDKTVLAAAQKILDDIEKEYGVKFATSEVELNGARDPGNRTEETNNGDLITDAMVWYLTEKNPGSITEVDADHIVAITNGGGIRAAVKKGDVTKKDIFTVLPFGNTLAVVYVTGAELLEALEASTYCTPTSIGGFPQIAGMNITIATAKTYDKNEEVYPGSTYYGPKTINRVTIDEINGKPFDKTAKYAVITNDFLAGGGDTYYAFAAATSQFDTGYTLDSVVIDYITEKLGGVIKEADYGKPKGRITLNNTPIVNDVTVPSTARTGGEIHAFVTLPSQYDKDGSYPLVVMLHGHGGNHNEWGGYDTISANLSRKGIAVVTMDFPGCGDSTESFQLNTMTNMKADVLDVIKHVTTNYAIDKTRVGGFGYSMGGRILLEMTAEDQYGFATMELVAPAEDTADLKLLFGGVENWDKMKAEAEKNGFANYTTIYGQKQELSKAWFADLEKYSDGLAEKAADKYEGNSLVIWATDDVAVHPEVSAGVAAALDSVTINTYAEGHSYSFYGKDPYTVSTVNQASVNYFVNELTVKHSGITGYVQSIAKYGNLELTVPGAELEKAGFAYGDILKITIGGKEFSVPYGSDYSDVDQGSVVLRNSGGHLTLAINMGNFAEKNGFATKKTNEDKTYEWYYANGVAMPLTVSIAMGEKGGYYEQWLIHQLKRTNNREDYAGLTDAQFANFRVIATTGMGRKTLYRSSSPINPELGRNTYADKAAKAAGIKTFMNLADNEEKAKTYEGYADSYYAKQNVVFLNLGVDFTEPSFKKGLADGLRYMTTHEGPYLVHCTEGKDRAGFVSALLECFMGATYDEVCADYMTTYENYYGVEKGTEKYTAILNSNIVKSLKSAFGVEDLTKADLKAEAADYLKEIGLTDAEIAKLAENLGGKPYENPFTDVKSDAWYYSYVMEMAEADVIKGMTKTTFEPEGELTRAQAVTLLYRIAGEPKTEGTLSFTDVKADVWYADAVKWGEKTGVVNGMTKTTFEPEGKVTRAQFVTMLYRYAGKPETKKTETFSDLKGDWYVDAVSWAEANGIVNGMTKTTFVPDGNCTRAQAAKILCVFLTTLTK